MSNEYSDWKKEYNENRNLDCIITEKIMCYQVLGRVYVADIATVSLEPVYLENCCCEDYKNYSCGKIFGHTPHCLKEVPHYFSDLNLCFVAEEKLIKMNKFDIYIQKLSEIKIDYDIKNPDIHLDAYWKTLAMTKIFE